jgi:hypothetical protein
LQPVTLSDDTLITRRAPDADLDALVHRAINTAGVRLMLPAPDLRALLDAVSEADNIEGTNVGALIATIGKPGRETRRAILWLAKLGIVRLSPA